MIIERFYLKCLAHASYIIADEQSKEAAIVDPQRDILQYEESLARHGLTVKYILETHLHADFVSGHQELSHKLGGDIVYSHKANAQMPHHAVQDGDVLMLGKGIAITVLETPGHSPESLCYLVQDNAHPDQPFQLFSGDTLFVGDVGRPDLWSSKVPALELANLLYTTIETKIKTLPDSTRVYPAHGAGSACGKKLGDAEFTTIGAEKLTNYALRATSKEEFIQLVMADQPDAPGYFAEDPFINRTGAPALDEVLAHFESLSPDQVEAAVLSGALILDTRSADEYASGSIPGALNIGLNGQYANWVGTLIPKAREIVVLCHDGAEYESAMRCARIGYDNVIGYVKGGMEGWKASGRDSVSYERVMPKEVYDTLQEHRSAIVLDVRTPSEHESTYIEGTLWIPLNKLEQRVEELPKDKRIIVHCGGGYRSGIAVSLLKSTGFSDVCDMIGGITEYVNAGYPVHGTPMVEA